MQIVNEIQELNKALALISKSSIGFVPTMGFLHQGHCSLIKASKKKTNFTIVTIFINPTQFTNKSDIENYPVSLEQDLFILNKEGVDLVFCPNFQNLFLNEKMIDISLEQLDKVLEGNGRKGHFEGVIRVLNIFFNLINPSFAFFGEKDYQQYLIVKYFANHFYPEIKIIPGPTQRELSGLAMSSRNSRLSLNDFEKSKGIFKVLTFCKSNFEFNKRKELEKTCFDMLSNFSTPEYFEIRHADDLLNNGNQNRKWRAFAATRLGGVRLIDNIAIN